MNIRKLSCSLALLMAGACAQPPFPQHPPMGSPPNATAMHKYYDPFVDAAAAHDMAVADIHFFPHTPEINGVGVQKIEQIRKMLDQFGGTLRYETDSKDHELIDARLAKVREYLADTGSDMTSIHVAAMMSGGRGMLATDAIEARTTAAGTDYGGDRVASEGTTGK